MINKPISISTHTSFTDTLACRIPQRWSAGDLTDDDLLLEAATLEEIELAYLGNEILAESEGAMFEAITTRRIKLAQTMRAFIRVLNRGLNGTGIRAGTDEVGADESGQNSIGGAIIGKVRRVTNIPVMTAQIPLTDGQTTSIIFHSPTAEGIRVKNDDTLVAFQFLINKRDVTHVVAPIGGRDVTLNQVCQVLSNLIERNSAKFQKAKERQAKTKADIESYLNESDKLTDERSTLIGQVEAAQNGLSEKRSDLTTLQDKLEKQRGINADLQSQLDKLKAAKDSEETERPFIDQIRAVKNGLNIDGTFTLSNGAIVKYSTANTDAGPQSYVTISSANNEYRIQAKDMQGKNMEAAATTLLKAYRENKAGDYLVVKPAAEDNEPAENPVERISGLVKDAVTIMAQGRDASGYTAREVKAAADLMIENETRNQEALSGRFDTVIANADGSAFVKLPPQYELARTAAQFVIYALGGKGDKTAMTKAVYASISRTKPETLISRLEKANSLLVANGETSLFTPEPEPEPEPEPQPEPTDTGDEIVSESDQEANKALEYAKALPGSFTSRDLLVINAEFDHLQDAANALISAGRFEENEATIGLAVDHLINILAEIQREVGY